MHIFAQDAWHGTAFIAGEQSDLLELRDAIDHALAENVVKITSFTNDGEGYDIFVIQTSTTQIDKLPLPYSSDYAKDSREDRVSCFDLIKENKD